MSCISNCLKLPKMNKFELVKCIRISMDNGEIFTTKINDMVGIQFVKNDKQILVRRGRIKDIVVINRRTLSTHDDNVSHIILDCSKQFSIEIIEIKIKDIIKIAHIDYEFNDYRDRIKELEPNYIKGNSIPVRQDGMITKEEMRKKVTKPNKQGVVKVNPATGEFDDLYDMNMNRPYLEELRASEDEIKQIEEEKASKKQKVSKNSAGIPLKGIPLRR